MPADYISLSIAKKGLCVPRGKKMSQAERLCLSSVCNLLADLFLNLSSLTNSVSEVVELSSANFTVSYDLNLVYNR